MDHLLALHTWTDAPGTPLVLLHGFPLDHRMWADAARRLPEDIAVHALDLPGLGSSPTLPEVTLEAAADAVVATLAAAGVDRAVVAGLSMGGYAALALAERHPDLVAGLALVDTKSTADGGAAREKRIVTADEVERTGTVDAVLGMPGTILGERSRVEQPALVPTLEAWITEQAPEGVAWSQRAMAARPDRTGVLEGYQGTSVVVVGSLDTVTPVSDAEHMADALRSGPPVVLDGVGHMSAVEAPAEVAAVLADLMRRT
ncbi:alpha/beta fold hydrolase [Sanguibacter suaedae]|uniref:Alpha/beta fold hydrolase n=1 Tax=Sanguibacter suaedae TaxID=2795737 RepID=A0A934MAS1_9MICO|nr:alpha/beta fold hydrolase [Sanguibacter suaedae]MBI9116083.1 alpha/beta fold hydrolase [Sanguibacter suaedae]